MSDNSHHQDVAPNDDGLFLEKSEDFGKYYDFFKWEYVKCTSFDNLPALIVNQSQLPAN